MLEESESNLIPVVEQNHQSREEKRECDNDRVINSSGSGSGSVNGSVSGVKSEIESDNDNDNYGDTKPELPQLKSHLLKPMTLTDGGYFSSEELKKAREKGYCVLCVDAPASGNIRERASKRQKHRVSKG